MAKDGKKPPGGKDKNPFRIIETEDSNFAKPSADVVKQIYMASPNIEWISFAKSQGWDPNSTRNQYPINEWITQKKEQLAKEQSEQISELIFNHRSRWHRDVLKTLKEYPEANDAVLGLLKKRINDIIGLINVGDFSKVKTSELLSLSAAVKVTTESKHKSLLINDWSVKIAEQFTDPKQFEQEELKMKDVGWKIEVIGGENLTSEQMQQFIGKYYDKPMQKHTPAQLEPIKEDEEE